MKNLTMFNCLFLFAGLDGWFCSVSYGEIDGTGRGKPTKPYNLIPSFYKVLHSRKTLLSLNFFKAGVGVCYPIVSGFCGLHFCLV